MSAGAPAAGRMPFGLFKSTFQLHAATIPPMKPSRNDPCPCGSGKKYKKCCLAKDEAEAPAYLPPPKSRGEGRAVADRAERSAEEWSATPERESGPTTERPKALDPVAEERNQWWDEFEASDFEERIGLFQRALDRPDLTDDDLAYEALDAIRAEVQSPQQQDRLNQLLAMLQERLPQVYDSSRSFYVSWRIDEALAAGDVDRAADLVREMADSSKTNIDMFHHALDMLAYHGRLNDLVDVMRRAWPWIKDSDDIVPWAIDGYAQRGGHYEMFAYVVERGDASAVIRSCSIGCGRFYRRSNRRGWPSTSTCCWGATAENGSWPICTWGQAATGASRRKRKSQRKGKMPSTTWPSRSWAICTGKRRWTWGAGIWVGSRSFDTCLTATAASCGHTGACSTRHCTPTSRARVRSVRRSTRCVPIVRLSTCT